MTDLPLHRLIDAASTERLERMFCRLFGITTCDLIEADTARGRSFMAVHGELHDRWVAGMLGYRPGDETDPGNG